jgi:hypothetical protein
MTKPEEPNTQTLRALRLIALALLRGMKQREQIDLMDKAGYGPTEIANFLSSTPKAISVRLAELRKAREGRPLQNRTRASLGSAH